MITKIFSDNCGEGGWRIRREDSVVVVPSLKGTDKVAWQPPRERDESDTLDPPEGSCFLAVFNPFASTTGISYSRCLVHRGTSTGDKHFSNDQEISAII